jgi:hypothetical protein
MRQIRRMTSFHRSILVLLLGTLATGCITTAEQQAKRNEDRCVTRGYKPGTDEFKDCVVRVDSERDQRMEQNRRNLLEKPDSPGGPKGY